jgi:hypothetical protein
MVEPGGTWTRSANVIMEFSHSSEIKGVHHNKGVGWLFWVVIPQVVAYQGQPWLSTDIQSARKTPQWPG